MDVLTKWFQFSLGVEPNKATLQGLAQGVNDYIQTLSEGQQALAQYASQASPEQFLSSTPLSNSEKQKLIEQYVSSPKGKQELESRLKKQEKANRQPIIWQIPEEKMNELKWQRTQLLRLQAQQQGKKAPTKSVTQGPVKKVGPQRKNVADGFIYQPPKLGSSKSSLASAATSKAPSVAGGAAAKPQQAANQARKNVPNGVPAKPGQNKAPAKGPANTKAPAKAASKINGVAK
ncbi:MAG: hypothetical protein Q9222_003982 [Ikaeria aurantiellina]